MPPKPRIWTVWLLLTLLGVGMVPDLDPTLGGRVGALLAGIVGVAVFVACVVRLRRALGPPPTTDAQKVTER